MLPTLVLGTDSRAGMFVAPAERAPVIHRAFSPARAVHLARLTLLAVFRSREGVPMTHRRSTLRRSAAALVAALCLSLVAAGCSDDSEPEADAEPTPSETSSTSSIPSPSATQTSEEPDPEPTPPTLPTAAEGSGDKAARAFVRHWVRMVNYAMKTGDVAPLDALHASYCGGCEGGVEQVRQDWSDGKSLVGGKYRIVKLQSVESTEQKVHVVGLVVRSTPQKVLDRKGKVVAKAPSALTGFRLYMRRDGGSWVVGALEGRQ